MKVSPCPGMPIGISDGYLFSVIRTNKILPNEYAVVGHLGYFHSFPNRDNSVSKIYTLANKFPLRRYSSTPTPTARIYQ